MKAEEPTLYAESLAFLVSQVGAHSARLFVARLKPLGVTPRAYGVMSHLVEGGPQQTQQSLADILGIHRNIMVGVIDELEQAGWVRRERSERDRRAFEIRLTSDGAKVVRRVDEVVGDVDEAIVSGLADPERRTLKTLLVRVAADLNLAAGVHPDLGGRT